MSKTLTMSAKELDRAHFLRLLTHGTLTVAEVSEHLGISERQCFRLKARYKEEGEAGLVHRLRGRPSNHGIPSREREEVVELYRSRFHDYGPTYFCEKVAEIKEYSLDPETTRRWLLEAGLWERARHRSRHRKKRPRRTAMGSLVQVDGSIHDWFEGRGAVCCLFVYVDDASSKSFFRFSDQETIRGGLTSMRRYIERNGIAEQLYLDKKNIYRNPGKLTQFARAAHVLGTEMIYANSPQAKGRVERANRTHQDRLVKALRERNISTIEEANRFLEEEYIDAHNARFAKTEGLEDLHRPVGERDLNNIICIEEERYVNHDMTFQFEGIFYQILPTKPDRPIPRQAVVVRRWLDDSLHAFWREKELDISSCAERPRKQSPHLPHPPENHPWRHSAPIGRARRKSISELCRKSR